MEMIPCPYSIKQELKLEKSIKKGKTWETLLKKLSRKEDSIVLSITCSRTLQMNKGKTMILDIDILLENN